MGFKQKFTGWFIKVAFPFIKKLLIRYADEIIEFIISYMKKAFSKRKQEKKQQYEEEIREKETQMKQTSNESIRARLEKEIIKLKSQLEANEELIEELYKIMNSSKSKIKEDIIHNTNNLKANDFIDKKSNELKLDQSKQLLDTREF
ncbi:hypothetical protein [Gracilibacillus salinarum]|uniref:Uncharacterized protein n=1 Tax=Gracilibacillus salinarum TaxID=2932255 RepID=A0ABY4GRS8_9BACI|nr:hypothetical protein [Gracilibacillus salinarum]UOQ86974.1 hypothetical protein MUN87_08865 [Gracilibacillus salinarum]